MRTFGSFGLQPQAEGPQPVHEPNEGPRPLPPLVCFVAFEKKKNKLKQANKPANPFASDHLCGPGFAPGLVVNANRVALRSLTRCVTGNRDPLQVENPADQFEAYTRTPTSGNLTHAVAAFGALNIGHLWDYNKFDAPSLNFDDGPPPDPQSHVIRSAEPGGSPMAIQVKAKLQKSKNYGKYHFRLRSNHF